MLARFLNARFLSVLCCLALVVSAGKALSQDWPTRSVRFILPSPPASSPDRITRLLADQLSKRWGQPVVVENRPGGTTRIGTDAVAKSAPDGYTLLSTFGTHSTVKLLYPDTPYDPIADFAPIVQYAAPEVIFVVPASSPYKTFKELVEGIKKDNRALEYAHFGNGSSFHFYGLVMGKDTGITVLPVPYKGEALQMTDLLGNHVESSFNSVGTALPHLKDGKIRALAILGTERSKTLPDVPTFPELGVPRLSAASWFGFLAPAGTPDHIVQKIANDVREILATPEVTKTLRDQGIEPGKAGPDEFKRVMEAEVKRGKELIAEFDVSVN